MSGKKRLGKGLGALIPEMEDTDTETGDVKEVPISNIKPNPYQPRKNFDESKLEELASSIREHGIIQPLMLTPHKDGGYMVVAGERRWRAATLAEMDSIPAVIKEVEEQTLLQVALIENLQREDLNPIEEAQAYQRLINEFSLTQDHLSKRIGKSRSAIANTLRLLSLPERVQHALSSGYLTEGQARPLLAIKNKEILQEVSERLIQGHYTAREVEKMVSKLINKKEETSHKEQNEERTQEEGEPEANMFYEDLRETLQEYLGTRVKISPKKKGGSVEIEYYGKEDLERVVSLIMESKILEEK